MQRPSQTAQRLAYALRSPIANTGDWMARNEQIRNLQNEMRTMYGGAGDAMNRAFYDATRTEAARRANTGDPNHISNQIFNAIANNGSQMMVPGATFQLPSGDQALNYVNELQRQGGQVGDSVRQMAADSDWLNRQTRTGLYASGSLNNWQANPLAYRSMNGPAKQIIDIDSEDSLAFGGDGSQMARQLGQGIIRDNQWARDAQARQNQAAPRPASGGYIGPSQEYLDNIKTWSKQPNNLWYDQNGKLARMNYGSAGDIESVSSRVGDTYTQRQNPDGKYTNWNWAAAQPRQAQPRAVQQSPQPQSQYAQAPSIGPAQWTGYGRNDGASGMPDAGWIDTPGDNWRWDKGDASWTQDGIPEPVDPVNSQWINDLRFKGRQEAERNQGLGSTRSFGALPAAMGAAQAPMIYSRPAPAQPKPQPAQAPNPMKSPVRPFNASDFSMNTLEPSRAFGGTLSPGWLDVDMAHGPLFVNTYRQAPRTMGDNAFSRYETNPFSAGRIQAFMR